MQGTASAASRSAGTRTGGEAGTSRPECHCRVSVCESGGETCRDNRRIRANQCAVLSDEGETNAKAKA